MEYYAIDLFTAKIASILENEVSLLLGIERELEEIKRELEYMKASISDSKTKTNLTDVEETWVNNVKNKAREIVDLIEEFAYYVNKKQSKNMFYKFIHFPKTCVEKHQLATKLRHMKKTIMQIGDRKQRYATDRHDEAKGNNASFKYDTNWVTRSIGESALYQDDDDLVGIDDAKQKLLDLLVNGELERTVVSVVGMGGSGKTSLVASVLRSHAVKQHFNGFYAWITISQTNYTIENLLRSMVKEFGNRENEKIDTQKLNQTELVRMLVDKLKRRKYLVVLDDVWEIDNLWIALKQALPANLFGSRVILTTRKEDVASFAFGVRSHVYNIELLPENKASELFWKRASPLISPAQCSRELEDIAGNLVRKCGGLPIALSTLGAFLSTKEFESREWRKVLQRLTWELSNNPRLTVLKSVFLYSFNELPYQLKQCFLHCCIFPEDYVLTQGRLVRLWIAEGFVEQGQGMTQEEMAESYIKELIHRNMLQVFKRPDKIKFLKPRLKIHDLVREFAVSILEAEGFCTIYSKQEEMPKSSVNYRLAMQANYVDGASYMNMLKVRSFFNFDTIMSGSSLTKLLSGFKLLRVLDLKETPLSELPKRVFNCYNLRCLNLKGTKVAQLPEDIGKLCNLITLDIRHTNIRVLPDAILKLQNLRHLLLCHHPLGVPSGFDDISGTKIPASISRLKNLQVVDTIEVEEGSILLKELISLTQLTRIGLRNVKEANGKELCILIETLKRIHYLTLIASDNEVLQIDQVLSVPPDLEKLYLLGKLQRMPSWISSLSSLKVLLLNSSRLTQDFLPQVGALPCLISLSLAAAYNRNHLRFHTGFQRLKKLKLRNFPQLDEILIGRGVMPELQLLGICDCMRLSRVPLGIEHLRHLENLNLRGVKTELVERIRNGGHDYPSIQHIPIVMLDREVF